MDDIQTSPASSTGSLSPWHKPRSKLDGLTIMQHLYSRFDGMYPNIWRANFHGKGATANWEITWADAFEEDGITPQQIADGLKACRRLYDKPPSLTEFLKACQPERTADPETLFRLAVEQMLRRRRREPQQWPFPGLFWAAMRLAEQLSQDIAKIDYKPIAGLWRNLLAVHANATAEVPDVAPDRALAAPQGLPVAGERTELQERLQNIGKMTDGLRLDWAEAIAENPRIYPFISRRYAFEVLSQHKPEALSQALIDEFTKQEEMEE